MKRHSRGDDDEPEVSAALLDDVRRHSRPLRSADDLTPLLDRIGTAHYALLGEASHGTSEYYRWRTRLSQRLIVEKGFRFLAVEGDWPDCYLVNRYVKGYPQAGISATAVLKTFRRWPTWMWANAEVVELIEWLRKYNVGLPPERKVGFYGLDVYSLWDSLSGISEHVSAAHPEAVPALQRVLRCFEPYSEDVQEYAHATLFHTESCEDEVVALLERLRRGEGPGFDGDGREAHFAAEQNAHVLKNAEAYYRTMVRGGATAWNLRDTHMMDTLDRLVAYHGDGAKAIVWEHNTHIGDARFTDMASGGQLNVGQMARERHGEDDAVLVGFGSHHGRVVAGSAWDAPMQSMRVPGGREGSWEDILHRVAPTEKLMIFPRGPASEELLTPRGHRAIGVVYRPELERHGNYVPTVLPQRYDAFLYIDATTALKPLHVDLQPEREPPETYPSTM